MKTCAKFTARFVTVPSESGPSREQSGPNTVGTEYSRENCERIAVALLGRDRSMRATQS